MNINKACRTIMASHSITATFTGTGGSGGIPQTGRIHCSYLTDNLPASGPTFTPSISVVPNQTIKANTAARIEQQFRQFDIACPAGICDASQ